MLLPRAKKSYGQNFLIDHTVVEKIVVAADIKKGETVLEIGPGTGALTEALVRAGAHVIAIEADHDLIAPLRAKFGDSIELIEGDVLEKGVRSGIWNFFPLSKTNLNNKLALSNKTTKIPLSRPDPNYKLVANIPYNITSQILERFLSQEPRPSLMVLMLQKEVADRILAKPPKMSLLSVMCQLYAQCLRVTNVKAGAFRPIPKVDSAVVKFELKDSPPFTRGESEGGLGGFSEEVVVKLAKAGFSSRRKQLHHNLLPYVRRLKPATTTEDIKALIVSIGLDPKVRAENLTVEDWIRLHEFWSKNDGV